MSNNTVCQNALVSAVYARKIRNLLLRFFAISLLCVPLYTLSSETETTTKADTEVIPGYNTLTNDDLLSHATGTYQEAFNLYLSEIRGLARSAFLLKKIRS